MEQNDTAIIDFHDKCHRVENLMEHDYTILMDFHNNYHQVENHIEHDATVFIDLYDEYHYKYTNIYTCIAGIITLCASPQMAQPVCSR